MGIEALPEENSNHQAIELYRGVVPAITADSYRDSEPHSFTVTHKPTFEEREFALKRGLVKFALSGFVDHKLVSRILSQQSRPGE